jgi:thiol-disulfide isomerase/thioredoxin
MLLRILVLCLLTLAGHPAAAGKSAPGAVSLPVLALQRLDGTATTTAEWRGRPLVLNIWATWCPPCRSEMPSLQRLADRLEAAGIGVAALSVDEDANLVREFVLKYGIRFPVAIAAAPGAAMSALGAVALPLTVYVDADGRIIEHVLGQRDWADEALARDIRAKLAPALRVAGERR